MLVGIGFQDLEHESAGVMAQVSSVLAVWHRNRALLAGN